MADDEDRVIDALQRVMLRPDLSEDERIALAALRDLMIYRPELMGFAKSRRARALIAKEWSSLLIWLGAIVSVVVTLRDDLKALAAAVLRWLTDGA